jgi:hypothetical protein
VSNVVAWAYRLWCVAVVASVVFAVWALARAQDDDYDGFDYFGVALVIDIVVVPAGFWLFERVGRKYKPGPGP